MNRLKTVLPTHKPAVGERHSANLSPTNGVATEEIVRAVAEPSAQTLTSAVVRQLQRTHGNQFVQRLMRQAQSGEDLSALAAARYPEVDPSAATEGESSGLVVQRVWTTYLLDYTTMSNEKTQGQIRTGAWKKGGGIEDWVNKFHKGLRESKPADALNALNKLKERLQSDKDLAARGKLKAPKGVKHFDKQAAMGRAVTFFNKWIQAVQDHIDYAAANGDWITDFREKYINEALAAAIPPKDAFLQNVANVDRVTSEDLQALGIMWDRGDNAQRGRMTAVMGGVTDLKRVSSLEYVLEAISPVHIGYDTVLKMFRYWSTGVLYHNVQWDWQTWLPTKVNDTSFGTVSVVTYHNAVNRANYQLTLNGKRALKANGAPLVGNNIYVLSKNNIWYAGPDGSGVHHSSFMEGEPVKCAGHIHTDNSGNVQSIDNNSGHYAPNKPDLKRAVAVLQSQMDTSDVRIHGYGSNVPQTVENFLKS